MSENEASYATWLERFRRAAQSDALWDFIAKHLDQDVKALRLRYQGRQGDIDYNVALTQIECRRRFATKFSDTLKRCERFLFADELVGEQATSDDLARYHASRIEPGVSVCDLTAGAGIDLWHIAARGCQVSACELDPRRAAALAVNADMMGVKLNSLVYGDSTQYLDSLSADIAFVDPARRDATGGRVFSLADCQPDITALTTEFERHYRRVIVKASPMLDITAVATSLPFVHDIEVIGTPTECRELLITMDYATAATGVDDIELAAVTVTPSCVERLAFNTRSEREASVKLARPEVGARLFLPYPAILKAGCIKLWGQINGLSKLAPNTHVYIGDSDSTLNADRQGTIFNVDDIVTWQSKNLKRFAGKYPRGWVATRNMGLSAESLRAKLGVKPGGDLRILGLTDAKGEKMILVLSAINAPETDVRV